MSSPHSDEGEPRGPRLELDARVRGLTPSATIAIQERSAELAREGKTIHKLGLGQSPFPVPAPVVDALRLHAAKKDYLPVRGLPALREAVVEYHRRRHGVGARAEDVLIAPGSKELMFLLQVVHEGDLLIPTPGWVSYEPQARIAGRLPVLVVHTYAENGYKLLPGDLEALCARRPGTSRVLILNYPSNPTGLSYTASELAALADVARRRRVIVLSDEIYGELHHEGAHTSIAALYPEGTIVSSGLSKWCGAGGWRLGTFVFPPTLEPLVRAMAAVASETYTSTSAPIQFAAIRAFQGGIEIERYLARSRRILKALARVCAAELRACDAALPEPEGAFYIFPDFGAHREALARRGITTGAQLTAAFLDELGVACLPGSDFGRSSSELTVRMSLVDFDGARALAAVEELPDEALDPAFVERYCASVVQAVRGVRRWVCGL